MIDALTTARFWVKVQRGDDASCWLWLGAQTPAGYGKLGIKRRTTYAHHVSLALSGRPRPDGAIALHSCDNPSCVNPSHLSWGDHAANIRQAIDRGRAPHEGRVAGMKNGNAKLTDDDVRAIRASSGTHPEVAARFGVCRSLIGMIRSGDAWRHL